MKKKRLIGIISLFLFAAAVTAILLSLYLNYADEAVIRGNVYADSGDVAAVVFPQEEDTRLLNILMKDLRGGFKNDAFHARIKLNLTSMKTVTVIVTEEEPRAAILREDHYLLVTEKGVYLGKTDTVPEGLRTVLGVEITELEPFTVPVSTGNSLQGAVDICMSLDRFQAPGDPVTYRDGGYFLSLADVTVAYGKAEYLNEKAEALLAQEPYYEGLKGTLHMEEYDGSKETQKFYFTVE